MAHPQSLDRNRRSLLRFHPLASAIALVATLALLLFGATQPFLQGLIVRWAQFKWLRPDLVAHFGAHAIIAGLLPIRPLKAAVASIAIAFAVEALQATSVAVGRKPSIDDIGAAACGAVIGAYGSLVIHHGIETFLQRWQEREASEASSTEELTSMV